MPFGHYMNSDRDTGAPAGLRLKSNEYDEYSMYKLLKQEKRLEVELEKLRKKLKKEKEAITKEITKKTFAKVISVSFFRHGVEICFESFKYSDVEKVLEILDIEKNTVRVESDDVHFVFWGNWSEHMKKED